MPVWPVETVNFYLALGTLALQIAGAAFLILFFIRKESVGWRTDLRDVGNFLSRWGLWIGFLLSLGASAMTLYYSEVLGIAPCAWCWFQRVFLYPQIFLFALAIWKRDREIADYSILLSIPGLIIALYQHYLQMGGTSVIPCPATSDKAVDCAVRFVFEFNYITFPLMAATLFGFLIVLMLFVRPKN